jgi:hypothetical protein
LYPLTWSEYIKKEMHSTKRREGNSIEGAQGDRHHSTNLFFKVKSKLNKGGEGEMRIYAASSNQYRARTQESERDGKKGRGGFFDL